MNKLTITSLGILSAFLFACEKPINTEENHSNKKTEVAILDPLPSWNEGEIKSNIIAFVDQVIDEKSASYVAPADRIATFDNDGCLWSEQPMYFQLYFIFNRIKTMAADHPEWKEKPLFAAVLNDDIKTIMSFGTHGLLELTMASSTGMNTSEFEELVRNWVDTAMHPTQKKKFIDMTYQPMKELLNYLRANEFKTYIVSGGGQEFMRPWTEAVYGIPSEQVIGTTIKFAFEMTESGPVMKRLPELDHIDDKAGKPESIQKFIGKKPIFAAGNSDGDLQMMQWSFSNSLPNFQLYIHHTDADREWAYDRESHIGQFNKGWDYALENNWNIVDMEADWATIYE